MVDRLSLSNSCVSGLKEVRSGSYGRVRFDRYSMFDVFDVRSSVRLVFEGNYEYKSGTRKKLETLAKVIEVVTS
jgi:hypothetical protein